MKRIIALILVCLMTLTACTNSYDSVSISSNVAVSNNVISSNDVSDIVEEAMQEELASVSVDSVAEDDEYYGDLVALNVDHIPDVYYPEQTEFYSLDDDELIDYVEAQVAAQLMAELDPNEYVLEDICAQYMSKEYIEELTYNSKTNVFFGYSLDEVDQVFQGTRYVFTLGEKGNTIVTEFEEYDDSYEKMIKNVAIGTGVIVICVTVSLVSAGVGAPASITYILTASAKTAAEFAVSSAVISGAITTGITAYVTGDWEEALKEGALEASDSFKWGAILGASTGGVISELNLIVSSSGGISVDDVAEILRKHKLPSRFLKQIESVEEFDKMVAIAENAGMTIEEFANLSTQTGYPLEVMKMIQSNEEGVFYFEKESLKCQKVGDRFALVDKIDLNYKSEYKGEILTNLERMKRGLAPIDPETMTKYELHHIGQDVNSPLATISKKVHNENYDLLHDVNIEAGEGVHAKLDNNVWNAQREQFWKDLAEIIETK